MHYGKVWSVMFDGKVCCMLDSNVRRVLDGRC